MIEVPSNNTCEFAETLKFLGIKHKVCGFCGDENSGCWSDESLRDLWHREYLVTTMLGLEMRVPGPFRATYYHDVDGRFQRALIFRAADIRQIYVALNEMGPKATMDHMHKEVRETKAIIDGSPFTVRRLTGLREWGKPTLSCHKCLFHQMRMAEWPINDFYRTVPTHLGKGAGWAEYERQVWEQQKKREAELLREKGLPEDYFKPGPREPKPMRKPKRNGPWGGRPAGWDI